MACQRHDGWHQTVTIVRQSSQPSTLGGMTERVSLQEAARRLGISVRTVQRCIAAGELQAEHAATSRSQRVVVLLELAPVEPEPVVTEGDTTPAALLIEVRAERDWLRGRVEALETTVRGLTVALAQAQHAMHLPDAGNVTSDTKHDTRHVADTTMAQPTAPQPEVRPAYVPQTRAERRSRPVWQAWLRRLLGE